MWGGQLITTAKAFAALALICLAACAGLALAANTSSPRQGTLKGQMNPSGHAKLLIYYRHQHGEKIRWYRWHFYRVPLKCKSGPAVARYAVKGGEGIWNKYADRNPFGGVSAEGSAKKPALREAVTGRLIDPNKAKGFVRVSGSGVPLRGGGHDKCDSGRVRWKVER